MLADVLELGEQAEALHREVGRFIAGTKKEERKTDLLITVGENASYIAKEAMEYGMSTVHSCFSNAEAIAYLKEVLKDGDVVLVKGSRGMKTDEIVKAFIKE